MEKIAVWPKNELFLAAAARLAARLALPLNSPAELVLTVDERLSLIRPGSRELPVSVDFSNRETTHRRKQGGGKTQLVARAVGLGKGPPPTVIDATAGLGGDSFVLACLGCRVTMIERSPVLAALLADGLARALEDPAISAIVQQNMRLIAGDSAGLLTADPSLTAEVIYLDPMYPHRDKSSLVKKEMRLLRQLVGDDPDVAALFAVARARATRRVVVKRPRLAPEITGIAPSFSLTGRSSRFDIYLTASLPQAAISRQPPAKPPG